jgi:hypothetical protein
VFQSHHDGRIHPKETCLVVVRMCLSGITGNKPALGVGERNELFQYLLVRCSNGSGSN